MVGYFLISIVLTTSGVVLLHDVRRKQNQTEGDQQNLERGNN
eukprot:CAMPEP_0185583168 /NCGR_PEP_ID=MMETSP0434-20130131/21361_1 /TAXON_ID=626734 ORGANISM="Favella taraikaensis, Strain Fe Narragansett Bay" /NCGR_SAMPLE_ID=MMETSP0434 /ASSEMBLY_ACC=CAM_ASM_000379 /LENGTH=41 /DNA_ID= /DNA_START= /DNA_END= /DNA_ORIENTATION=